MFQLQAELAAVREQLKRRSKQEASCRKRRKELGFTRRDVQVCLAILVLSVHNMQAASRYLQSRQHDADAVATAYLEARIREWYGSTSDEELLKIAEPSAADQLNICKTARRWLTEAAMVNWVRERNSIQRVAVPSNALLPKLNAMLAEQEDRDPLMATCRPTITSRSREWAYRWRKRHNVRCGKLRVREVLEDEDLSRKADCVRGRNGHQHTAKLTQRPWLNGRQKRGQKTAPKKGPSNKKKKGFGTLPCTENGPHFGTRNVSGMGPHSVHALVDTRDEVLEARLRVEQ